MTAHTARSSGGGFGLRGSQTDQSHPLAMAESVCGTTDRDVAARLFRSRFRLRRRASAAGSDCVFLLLQPDAHAPVVGQGRSARPSYPATWGHRYRADFVRAASLLRADMIFGNDSPHAAQTSRHSGRSAYYFVIVIRHETTAAARWALPFIVRTLFNDAITVAVWTGFHVCLPVDTSASLDVASLPLARPW